MLILGGLSFSAGGCHRAEGRQETQGLEVVQGSGDAHKPLKVWLIGWDGMAPWIVEPMMTDGSLPNLRRLADSGTVGEVESIAPAISPALWTTIATGKERDQHGIWSFWEEDAAGGEKLFTSRDRTAAPLWRIVDAAGGRSAVVGWWTTWPAEEIRGTIVSDRFARSRFDIHPRNAAKPNPLEGLVTPPEREADLRSCVRSPDDISSSELSRFVPDAALDGGSWKLHDRLTELEIVFARDESHWCIASRLLAEDPPVDFFAMHIQGTDIVSHYFLKYQYPELWTGDPVSTSGDEAASFRDTIASYYRWQDHRLGQLLSLADARTVVLVVSDHGFRVHARDNVPTVSGVHIGSSAPPGFLVASGPGIRSGYRLEHASVLDLAPTVLAILGLPRARDQLGSVLTDAMVRAPEAAWVDSYGSGLADGFAPVSSDLDGEIIQSLKAVGYAGR